MIDLGAAYDRVAAILAAHHQPHAAYKVGCEIWNHRRSDASTEVSFTVSAALDGHHCIGSFGRPTIDEALAELDRLLGEHLRPAPEPVTDLRVALPVASSSISDDPKYPRGIDMGPEVM